MRTNGLIRSPVVALFVLYVVSPVVQAGLVLSSVLSSSVRAGSATQIQLQIHGDPTVMTQVLGWQVSLQVEPQTGATGGVRFSGATIPSQDYLLGVNGHGLSGDPVSPVSRITLLDADTSNPLEGGTIGMAETLRLADIEIQSSSDATGMFKIALIDEGPTSPGALAHRTQWTNDAIEDMQFDNVARNSAPILLGTVSVTAVPEPNAFTYVLVVISAIGAQDWLRRRFKSKPSVFNPSEPQGIEQ